MKQSDTKRVAVINDLSGFGRCSLTVAIPILSALGIQACPIPTSILTNQTGFPSYKLWDIPNIFPTFIEEWKKNDVLLDGIYTGFISNASQLDQISELIKEFKNENTLLLVDPVMGDDGELYKIYDMEYCKKMYQFALKADIITPNLMELCLLTNTDYYSVVAKKDNESEYLAQVEKMTRRLYEEGIKTIVVTGIWSGKYIINAVYDSKGFRYFKSASFGGSFSGTGDIFSSVICGCLIRGIDIDHAIRICTSYLETAIRDTYADQIDRNEGIYFECHLNMLTDIVNREQSL